ncbi:MAG: low-specificity L-threonine aldolase [Anaerolineaceae bacterium]|nr:low-specificity L-threonine aldolase [Anaerolineaceae bacterium]
MNTINLLSDTVTEPTPQMRTAMANAQVGDDVTRDDPTVNRLEQMSAERMGKEAGLFIPSGTMGNLLALMCHCARGEEVILGNTMHTFLYEAGGAAVLASVPAYPIGTAEDGSLPLHSIQQAIRTKDIHCPVSRLIILENTHNRCAGVSLSAVYTQQVADLAAEYQLLLHIDGARIFNAAIDQQCDVRELVDPADSVTFCLSKGLGAPVGSVLCGSSAFIANARHTRKMLGGGMRQAGIIAAAGIVALESMLDRLIEDHLRAEQLAEALRRLKGEVIAKVVQHTNMIYVYLHENSPINAPQIAEKLRFQGVIVGVTGESSMRLVTHYWIDDAAIKQAIKAFRSIL